MLKTSKKINSLVPSVPIRRQLEALSAKKQKGPLSDQRLGQSSDILGDLHSRAPTAERMLLEISHCYAT